MSRVFDLVAPGLHRPMGRAFPLGHPREAESRPRRLLNVLIAALGILLTLPLMAVIALAIRWTSPGPVFFFQTRIGLDRRGLSRRPVVGEPDDQGGRPFRMIKFRTMRVEHGTAAAVWAQKEDPRITPIGRLLRKTRLDELPQLFNVLRGEMNVVGPRPEQPAIFATLRRQVSAYAARQRTRPGITGLAQVSLPYDTNVDDVRRKVDLDLAYLSRQSVLTDLRIMFLTFPVMLGRHLGW